MSRAGDRLARRQQEADLVLPSVATALSESYFNWQAWPNFTDRGKAPQLKKYPLTELTPGAAVPLQDTKMTVTAFPLSHGGVEFDGVLVESDGDAILYFGDTGPDPVEKTPRCTTSGPRSPTRRSSAS